MVDEHLKIEESKLKWVRHNQKKLRADLYKEIREQVAAGAHGVGIGKHVILPSSIAGSPRDLKQRYQDAMAIVRKRGKPDLFLTFTCNPRWKEITRELKFGQKAQDRPDLCARVFHLKLNELKKDLFERGVLGRMTAEVWVIEYQKRGLPHVHMLLYLRDQDKLRDPSDYDKVVCAEIPALDGSRERAMLREKVIKHHVHSHRDKCYAEDDPGHTTCINHYARPYQDETTDSEDSYPEYRRRSPEHGGQVHIQPGGRRITNADIVPYVFVLFFVSVLFTLMQLFTLMLHLSCSCSATKMK